jgi:hypothetical protein
MKYLKTTIFSFLILFFSSTAFGQSFTEEEFSDNLYFSAGLSFQKQKFGEVGIGYAFIGEWGNMGTNNLFLGLKIASEFTIKGTKRIVAPKISAEINMLFLGARFNIINYTDFNYNDVKFTPEIGITAFGLCNLFYGYNFSLSPSHFNSVAKNRLTLVFNFGKGFLK